MENRLRFNQMIFLVSVTLVVNRVDPMLGLAEQQIHLRSMQLHSSVLGAASAHSLHVVAAGPTTYRPSEPSLAA